MRSTTIDEVTASRTEILRIQAEQATMREDPMATRHPRFEHAP